MKTTVKYLGRFHSLAPEVRAQLLRSTLRHGQMTRTSISENPSVWASYRGRRFTGWAILTPREDAHGYYRRSRWFQVFVQYRYRGQKIAEAIYVRALKASRVSNSMMMVTMHDEKSEEFYRKMVRKYGSKGVCLGYN